MASARLDIQFQTPVINEIKFRINENFNEDKFNEKEEVVVNYKSSDILDLEDGKKEFRAIVQVSLGADEERFPFYIEVSMQSAFLWTENNDVSLEDYRRYNAPALIYSYLRPVVSDIVAKSGYAPYNLPFMNFTEDSVQKNRDD